MTDTSPLTRFHSHKEREKKNTKKKEEYEKPGPVEILEATVYGEDENLNVVVEVKENIPSELPENLQQWYVVDIKADKLWYSFKVMIREREIDKEIYDRRKIEYVKEKWQYDVKGRSLELKIPFNTIGSPTESIEWKIMSKRLEGSPAKIKATDRLPEKYYVTAAEA